MEESPVSAPPAGSPLENIITTAKAVLTDPAGFFRTMPRSGGFVDPLIFVVALSVVSALVALPFWLLGIGHYAASPGLIFAFIVAPVMTGLFSFAGAGVAFAVWRVLGSRESYETAYRCTAYMSAISPLAVPLGLLPYIGPLAMLIWGFFLVVIASELVHGIDRRKAQMVFGAIAVVFALISIGSQRVTRNMQAHTDAMTEKLEKLDEMSPEEAGKAVGEFMKGLQGAVGEEKKASGD